MKGLGLTTGPVHWWGHLQLSAYVSLAFIATFSSADSPYECSRADWRIASFFGAPVPNADFNPAANPLHSPYYRGPVLRKLIPTAVLFALLLVLLVAFLLWRVLRTCCPCCCSPDYTRPDKDAFYGRTSQTCKVTVVLLCVGVVIGSSYGMLKAGPHAVSDVLQVYDNVKDYADGGFLLADEFINEVDSLNPVMDDVEEIRVHELDAPSLLQHVTAVESFLANLANPSTVRAQLSTLEADLNATAADGVQLSTSIQTISGSTIPLLLNSIQSLKVDQTQLIAFNAKAAALQAAVASLPANKAAFTPASLQTSIQALSPISGPASFQTTVDSINTQLNTISSTGVNTASIVADLQSVVAKLSAIRGNASLIMTELTAAISQYNETKPHITALLEKITYINGTLVVLPKTIQATAVTLSQTQDGLERLIGGDTLQQLNNNVTALTDAATTIGTLLGTAITEVAAVQDGLDSLHSGAAQLSNSFQAISTSLSATQSACTTCSNLCSGFNAGSTDLQYAALKTGCSALTSPLTALAAGLNAINSTMTAAIALEPVLTQISSLQNAGAPLATFAEGGLSRLAWPSIMMDMAAALYNRIPENVFAPVKGTIRDVDTQLYEAASRTKGSVTDIVRQARSTLGDVRRGTLERVEGYEAQYVPKVVKYDKWRQAGQMVFWSLIIAAAASCVVSILVACPFLMTFSTFGLLLLLLLGSCLSLAFLAVVVVGNDGCHNAEPQLAEKVPDIFSKNADTAFKVETMLNYYLFEEGGPLRSLVNSTFGLDINKALHKIEDMRDSSLGEIERSYTLGPRAEDIVTNITLIIASLESRTDAAEEYLSFGSIHPLYLQVKVLVCCKGVDMLGNWWLALFLAASFGALAGCFMFHLIRRMDELPPRGCCGCACRSSKEFPSPRKHNLSDSRMSRLGGLEADNGSSVRAFEGLLKATKLVKAANNGGDQTAASRVPSGSPLSPDAAISPRQNSSFSVQQSLLSSKRTKAKTHKGSPNHDPWVP